MGHPDAPVFRLYLDESGDHSMTGSTTFGMRYLALTGVVIRHAEKDVFQQRLEDLKRKHFGSDPDDLLVLHREEIVAGSGRYSCLRDQMKRRAWNEDFLQFVRDTPFLVICVVLDKVTHAQSTYRELKHPYHYCMHAMMERYCGWLDYIGKKGDVLAEARGRTEDGELKEIYRSIYERGTRFMEPERAKRALTSKEIKLAKKYANSPGLQLADLLAHPLLRDVLDSNGHLDKEPTRFEQLLRDAVEEKYNSRGYDQKIQGYGRVFLR